jgi:hypothetical protein
MQYLATGRASHALARLPAAPRPDGRSRCQAAGQGHGPYPGREWQLRLANCGREGAWYELAGAATVTGLLSDIMSDVTIRYPGTALLGEPRYAPRAARPTCSCE